MSPMVGDALSVAIRGENSQRILLVSNHRQWTSPTSATYENQALLLITLLPLWFSRYVNLLLNNQPGIQSLYVRKERFGGRHRAAHIFAENLRLHVPFHRYKIVVGFITWYFVCNFVDMKGIFCSVAFFVLEEIVFGLTTVSTFNARYVPAMVYLVSIVRQTSHEITLWTCVFVQSPEKKDQKYFKSIEIGMCSLITYFKL